MSNPNDVTAIAGDGKAYITWTAPKSPPGDFLQNYTINVYPSTGSSFSVGPINGLGVSKSLSVYSHPTNLSYVMLGLTNGVSYQFTVYAINNSGTSLPESPKSSSITPRPSQSNITPSEGKWTFDTVNNLILYQLREGISSITFPVDVPVQYLVVGGGGAGGIGSGGGGGGGGLVSFGNLTLSSYQTYTCSVGNGGQRVTINDLSADSNGEESYIMDATNTKIVSCAGGGNGGDRRNAGKNGGTGGGGGVFSISNKSYLGGTGTFKGGTGWQYYAGGGGGAGGNGADGSTSSSANGAPGGIGVQWGVTGLYYGGGGGGGYDNSKYGTTGQGGTGGGGDGSSKGNCAQFGTDGFGGGGGGSTKDTDFGRGVNNNNGQGGKGTIIFAFSPYHLFPPTVSPLSIVYGTHLSSVTLNGGYVSDILSSANVDGIFSFTDPSTIPNGGTYPASITFTASSPSTLTLTTTANLTVTPIDPMIATLPTASVTYSKLLSTANIIGGSVTGLSNANVSGSFSFVTPNVQILSLSPTQSIQFTPTSSSYNVITSNVIVTVNPTTPTIISSPTTSNTITYGQPLSNVLPLLGGNVVGYDGITPISGAFSFSSDASTIADVNANLTIIFTPSGDATNYYTPVSKTIKASFINPYTPTIVTLPSASVSYSIGMTLANIVPSLTGGNVVGIDGNTPLIGSYAFNSPSTVLVQGGTFTYPITFTPSSSNYSTISGNATVIVKDVLATSGNLWTKSLTSSYTFYKFTGTDPGLIRFPQDTTVYYLLVGGGGAGGSGDSNTGAGGGGGGGQVKYGSTTFTKDTIYSCTAGRGGFGHGNGLSSTLSGANINVLALGGGYGGDAKQNGADHVPNGGGGGGGGSQGTPIYGGSAGCTYIGGNNTGGKGGGGGAGAGSNGSGTNTNTGSSGGSGYKWIDNNSYGGGGGGGTGSTSSGGTGKDGGGNGGNNNTSATNGTDGTGGGGGGGGSDFGRNGGNGTIILAFINTIITGTATASSIIYGQNSNLSTITGGLIATDREGNPLTGTYALNSGILSAGLNTNVQGTFTPTSADVQPGTFTSNITVLQNTPVVPNQPLSLTYGQSVPVATKITLTNSYNNSLTFTGNVIVSSVSTPSVGSLTLNGTFQPDDTTDYTSVPANLVVTVSQYSVNIANITASLVYGQTLGAATFSQSSFTNSYSGSSIGGTLVYTSSGTKPLVIGTRSYPAAFTPTDTTDYTTVTGNINATTSKYPTDSDAAAVTGTLTYGQKLSQATLSSSSLTNQYDSTTYTGTFSFGSNANVIANAGQNSYPVTFTPANTSVYAASNVSLQVSISPYTPDLTGLTASLIYGQKISSFVVTSPLKNSYNNESIPSTWVTVSNSIKNNIPTAGNSSVTFSFIPPLDNVNYSSTNANGTLTVSKYVVPTVTDLKGTLIYGQSLASAVLSSNVFTYSSGTATFKNSYSNTAFTGTFSYANSAVVPNIGVTTYSTTFIPTTSSNYTGFTSNVAITTAPYSVSLSGITATLTYGQTLAQATLSSTSFQNSYTNETISGTLAFASPSSAPNAGISTYFLTFTPNDKMRYANVSANITVTTALATLNIANITGSLTYGQAYSSTSYLYYGKPQSFQVTFLSTTGTTVPSVGTQTTNISVQGTGNYYGGSGSIGITVSKYTPNITQVTGSLTYGTPLANATITSVTNPYNQAEIQGSYSFGANGSLSNINPGTYTYVTTFTPNDTDNYNSVTSNITVTVTTYALSLNGVSASLTYGQKLKNAVITPAYLTGANGDQITGTYTFASANIIPSSSASYQVAFVPNNNFLAGYTNRLTGSILVAVNPYPIDLTNITYNLAGNTKPQAGTIVYGQTRSEAIFSTMYNPYNLEVISGSYSFGTQLNRESPDQGTETLQVTFTPTSSSHYTSTPTPVLLTTYAYAPSLAGVTASLTYGQALSQASFGGASLIQSQDHSYYTLAGMILLRFMNGNFTFANASVYPDAGQNQSFSVTFSPAYNTHNNDFAATTANITVAVARATATLGSLPNASPIYADQTLASSTLVGGRVLGVNAQPLQGTFSWANPSTILTTGLRYPTVNFVYTGKDNSNYLPFTTQANLSVIASSSSLSDIVSSTGNSSAFAFLQQLASTTPPRNTIIGASPSNTSYAFTIGDHADNVTLSRVNPFMRRITATSSNPENRIVVGTTTNGIIVLEFDKDNKIIPTEATTINARLATRYKTIYLRAGSINGDLIKRVHIRNGRAIEFQTLPGVSEYTFATS